jgi:hypothetical protein
MSHDSRTTLEHKTLESNKSVKGNQCVSGVQQRKITATDYACNTLAIVFADTLCLPLIAIITDEAVPPWLVLAETLAAVAPLMAVLAESAKAILRGIKRRNTRLHHLLLPKHLGRLGYVPLEGLSEQREQHIIP